MENNTVIDGNTSDGYHTFNELYDHRCLLWIALILTGRVGPPAIVKDHYEGWDLLAAGNAHSGQLSYHVPVKFRPLYDGRLLQITADDYKAAYNGHTPADVLNGLEKFIKGL